MNPALGFAVVALVVLALGVPPASAELYRFTDKDGVIHYTADLASIPMRYRPRALPLAHPQPRAGVPVSPPPSADESSAPEVSTSEPIRGVAGAPIVVAVRLNGTPLRLILDTGADRTVISPTAMARAGFGAEPSTAVQIVGVTGSAPAALVTVPILDVAGARIGPLSVVVHALDVATGEVDGLLGRDVLEAFTITIDRTGRATLTPR